MARQVVRDWTDNARKLASLVASHNGQLNRLLGAGQKSGSSASRGSRLDVHIGILRYPAAKPVIQLLVRNLAQTPPPDSQRQN
jgi:hypothetical protein